MAIKFLCPFGHRLSVADELAGKKGRCPVCRQRIYVPVHSPPEHLENEPLAGAIEAAERVIDLETPSLSPAPPPLPSFDSAKPAPDKAASGPLPERSRGLKPAPRKAGEPSFENIGPLVDSIGPAKVKPQSPSRLPPEAPPHEAYEPAATDVQTVWLLAAALALVTLFSAAPALSNLNLAEAPGWARLMLLLAALQLIYIAWMVTLPDWSTVWIGMLVFALSASIYAVGMSLVLASRMDAPLPLGMNAVRQSAAAWCGVVVLLAGTMAFFCGRISAKWRRTFELGRSKPAR